MNDPEKEGRKMTYQRTEYPRPQFRREDWTPLNGTWEFCFDDDGEGIRRGYPTGKVSLEKKIVVPFVYQCTASGIGCEDKHTTVWYRRTFRVRKDKRALLCFNGCDYIADVWVNGYHVITHRGAYAPFNADVTDYLQEDNVIVVRCYDPYDPAVPRGKQSWTGDRFDCWYLPSTGIWQSVWIEYFDRDCIIGYTLFSDADECSIAGEMKTLYGLADEAEIAIYYEGNVVHSQRIAVNDSYIRYHARFLEEDSVNESHYWSPDHPNLFYADFRLYRKGELLDEAHTRFGMRKISIDETGQICLNNTRIYQRMVLDQGYWEESGLTPPSAEALKKDILLCKEMGFNCARKHQKIEDPYYYYYAEELGLLTWCEMPSAYRFNTDEIQAVTTEWQEILCVARNFTSVICYVPLNESWGVRKILVSRKQQDFARALYYITKTLDRSRLISTNDGWENLDTTDIISIHDYSFDSSQFKKKYTEEPYNALYPQNRKLMANGCYYTGQPVLLTEFGGIAMKSEEGKNGSWGYNSGATDENEFLIRYKNLLDGIYECEFQGFCYTQLTDVQQEVNGLLRADRTPKFDMDKIREITRRWK